MTTPGRHAQPRERPLLRVYLNTRYRAADAAADVRWYAAKTARAVQRGARRVAAWLKGRDGDNDVPRPGSSRPTVSDPEGATGVNAPSGPGRFGRAHISGTVHDEAAWYQPHAAPDIPQGFWSPPALRDWLPELLEWALTAPIGEIRAAAA